ncbi:MAG: TerB family tellurite resistance protein [Maribacter sp.]|nr:TerB family tellurite resistance protein [Maribacter sp.]MBT8302090.1 TerB family tellurite resistance protein [Maribacter sp.]NNG09691.1 TerB family tellurite resistance protein [Arenibacter sp.]NNK75232.1 TerB family tellurite resistance protein [Maribacter sp.]
MEFSLAEKMALVKAIDEVIYVDGKVDTEEMAFMTQLMDTLNFDRMLVEEARKIRAKDCLSTLKGMTYEKKQALSELLNEMANVDGEFNKNEYRLIFNILHEVGIGPDF